VRSATSVAANYGAACRARSHAEFLAGTGTVEEEADESVVYSGFSSPRRPAWSRMGACTASPGKGRRLPLSLLLLARRQRAAVQRRRGSTMPVPQGPAGRDN